MKLPWQRASSWSLAAGLLACAAASSCGGGATEQVLPSTICRGLWVVPLSIEGSAGEPLQWVLDTGAAYSVVDSEALESATGKRVSPGNPVRIRGAAVGPLQIGELEAAVEDLDALGRALGTQVDGILGFPVFDGWLLTLDYAVGEIRVSRGKLPRVDGRTIFRDVGKGKRRPFLELEVGDATVPLLIDSGSMERVALAASDSVDWESEPRAVSASVGYGVIQIKRLGRLSGSVALGPVTLERPVVRVFEEDRRLLGSPLLERFVWTFDQRRHRIRMVAVSEEPIVDDSVLGTGLGYRPREDGFEVIFVAEGGGGEAAGVRPGDVVVAFDGVPVYDRGCESRSVEETDPFTDVTVRRDGTELEIRVENRILIP